MENEPTCGCSDDDLFSNLDSGSALCHTQVYYRRRANHYRAPIAHRYRNTNSPRDSVAHYDTVTYTLFL
jgi:hypothetical protein